MKTNFIVGSSSERVAILGNQPKVKRLAALLVKIRSGQASDEERKEFDSFTKRAQDLDPNVLIDS